jgi:hypothetical protein
MSLPSLLADHGCGATRTLPAEVADIYGSPRGYGDWLEFACVNLSLAELANSPPIEKAVLRRSEGFKFSKFEFERRDHVGE